jgi:3-oxoacyl-[acyl-carrier protein] reductase
VLLQNKVALVTGASRGIGEAIARKFAQHGATVVFTYHSSAERAEALAAELAGYGVAAKAVKSDAASFSEAAELINNIVKEFGKIDIIVNNAGITKDNLLMKMTEEQWDVVIDTNLKSVFNVTKHAIPTLIRQKSGTSIINITSIVGITGNAGQANYAASKAGIIGFTKSIAQEYGKRNVRCNAIAPGFIATEMTDALTDEVKKDYFKNIPLNRFGRAEEVAETCLFLASDMSSYISGQVFSVCGALNC